MPVVCLGKLTWSHGSGIFCDTKVDICFLKSDDVRRRRGDANMIYAGMSFLAKSAEVLLPYDEWSGRTEYESWWISRHDVWINRGVCGVTLMVVF